MKKTMFVLAAGAAMLMANSVSAQQLKNPPPQGGSQTQRLPQQQGGQTQRRPNTNRGGERGNSLRRGSDQYNRLGKDDQRLVEAIEEADSPSKLRRYLQQAMNSRSEEVRMAMVNALECADRHSATDFAYFIGDSSEEVADAAFSAWTSALEEVHGEGRVRAILETAEILRSYSGSRRQTSGQGSRSRQEYGPMTQRSWHDGQRQEMTPGMRR